jgi:hypothetical protein
MKNGNAVSMPDQDVKPGLRERVDFREQIGVTRSVGWGGAEYCPLGRVD